MQEDPSHYVNIAWRRLGLDIVKLSAVKKRSRTSTDRVSWTVDEIPGLRGTLHALYRGQMEALRGWGIDPGLWSNFAH